jgi:3-methyladenine DNA glycosylase AlkD
LTVPQVRKLAQQHRQLSLPATKRLLRSPIHEERLLALLILVAAFAKADAAGRRRIYETYLRNTRHINNWDLVDASAAPIVGSFLSDQSKMPLRALARSKNLWERRIAIIATFHFIRRGEFAPTLAIARQLLGDQADLIHKAVGWMLREVGKRDRAAEEKFLRRHYRRMPRTMLRYAIERFPQRQRQRYLRGTMARALSRRI